MNRLDRSWRGAWRALPVLILVLGLATPVWTGAAAAQTSLPETANAAPAATAVFSEIDLNRDGAQWQQADALLKRAGLPNPFDMWQNVSLPTGGPGGGPSQAELDAMLGGEMAVVISPLGVQRLAAMHAEMHQAPASGGYAATPVAAAPSDRFGVAMVLAPSDPDTAWRYAQRQLTGLAAARAIQVQAEQVDGGDLIWIEPGPIVESAMQDVMTHQGMMGGRMHGDGAHAPTGIAVGRLQDFVVVAKRQADVRDILDVIAGSGPSLADSTDAQAVTAELPASALAFTYLDGTAIQDAMGPAAMAQDQPAMAGMHAGMMRGRAGFAVSAEPAGFRLDSIFLPAPESGLEAMIPANDPSLAGLANQVPGNAFAFQAGTVSEQMLAQAPYVLAMAVNGMMAPGEEHGHDHMAGTPTPQEVDAAIAAATATLGFDPRADLFALLGGQYVAFASLPTFSIHGASLDGAAAVPTTDAARLAETARKLAEQIDQAEPNADVTVRRIGGDTVYVVANTEDRNSPPLAFGVIDGRALVGTIGGVEELAATPGSSLADDSQFQMVMGLLPSDYYQVSYVNIGQAIDNLSGLIGSLQPTPAPDADLACADYPDQASAQAALDADSAAHADLDRNGNGQACEDAFGTPTASTLAPTGNLGNIRALASASFHRGDAIGSTMILYIAGGV